ncbi:hypothetical protein glysoja_019326 [Glycine soja]|nr:hypothetical protein glysoja_019326 [Glycine soja]
MSQGNQWLNSHCCNWEPSSQMLFWNGYIYAVKEADGSLIWMKNLLMLTGLNATDGVVPNVNSTVSRSTPTVAGDLLIFGTYSPAAIIALKIKTGELVWKITLDDHPEALITMSGTYYNGFSSVIHMFNLIFLPLLNNVQLSTEDTMLEYLHWKHLYPLSDAAHSVESFVKLNARSGVIMWRT